VVVEVRFVEASGRSLAPGLIDLRERDRHRTYQFYQNGTSITMEETTPGYGQTAIGEGTIDGGVVTMTIQTALGSQGTLSVTLSADGRRMSGTYSDQTFGTSTPYTLTR
jgi:hypothetical protein